MQLNDLGNIHHEGFFTIFRLAISPENALAFWARNQNNLICINILGASSTYEYTDFLTGLFHFLNKIRAVRRG